MDNDILGFCVEWDSTLRRVIIIHLLARMDGIFHSPSTSSKQAKWQNQTDSKLIT